MTSVGEDPCADHERCARLHDFIAVDAASLKSLLELPSVLPPIRPFRTREEKWDICPDVSFVWCFDSWRTRRLSDTEDAGDAAIQGAWMKLATSNNPAVWFQRLSELERWRVFEMTRRASRDGVETPLSTEFWWAG